MSSDRHFSNQLETRELTALEVAEIRSALADALRLLQTPDVVNRDTTGSSVYVGSCGIALALQRAAEAEAAADGASSADVAAAGGAGCAELAAAAERLCFSALANWSGSSRRVTFLEGRPGGLALAAQLHSQAAQRTRAAGNHAAALQQLSAAAAAVQELQELASTSVEQLPPEECELLYGRSGYLFCLLYVRRHLGRQSVHGPLVRALVNHLLAQGAEGAAALRQEEMEEQSHQGKKEEPGGSSGLRQQPAPAAATASGAAGSAAAVAAAALPLVYSWHGKRYLGAAHGE